jgi:AraC family transcriptional regulator, ethanolamine operon transcriptional activator
METATFYDFESFAASLQHVDMRTMLTRDCGQRWLTHLAKLRRITIQYGSEGGGIICEGATLRDCVVLFAPMQNATAITCNGQVCVDNCWMLQTPDREFCYSVTAPNEWSSIYIPLELWTQLAEKFPSVPMNRLVRTSPPLIARYRELVRRFLAIDHDFSRFMEIQSIVDSIEAELLSAIMAMVSLSEPEPNAVTGRPVIPRGYVLRTAKELLDERLDQRPPAGTLAAATGVSERTLRNIFRDYYGIAPLRYLKLRQLHCVRSALKQADPQRDTVTRVISLYDVKEYARFAQQYRRLFGESPSDTLRGVTA